MKCKNTFRKKQPELNRGGGYDLLVVFNHLLSCDPKGSHDKKMGCVENEDPKMKTKDQRPSGLKRRPTGLKRRPRGLKQRPTGLKRRPTGLISVAHKLKCHLSTRQT